MSGKVMVCVQGMNKFGSRSGVGRGCDEWQPFVQLAVRVSKRHEAVGFISAKRSTVGRGCCVQHRSWMSPFWVSAERSENKRL